MKRNVILLCLCLLQVFAGCRSIRTESHLCAREPLAIDSLFIPPIILNGRADSETAGALGHSLALSLLKRRYLVSTTDCTEGKGPKARYQLQVFVYHFSYGDPLEPRTSFALFARLMDAEAGKLAASVRLSAEDLNLEELAEQERIAEMTAEKIDALIRGKR